MTFGLPAIPDKDDPRWTRKDGIFVPRTGGTTKWVIGDTTTVKISAAQTNGALGVLESSVPPGGGAVPHAHGREDEAFYVLSGDFEFVNGDQVISAGPGDFFFVPQGNRHGFTNTGALPAKLLTFLLPGGHERFWLDNGVDPEPGKPAPVWGPENFAALIPELTKHQVTLLPQQEL
ncbi:cupin domain-containing protein [Streptomyces sp. NBC_00988]|uniref:cupin domain-containing protein n=1 Tax=Streptomyces sp. NBC_00988 TaxID=2903704 RepID=UPI00386E6865|nr:cupin domain-containing protein [Streptomyces sp. NBC_00988]